MVLIAVEGDKFCDLVFFKSLDGDGSISSEVGFEAVDNVLQIIRRSEICDACRLFQVLNSIRNLRCKNSGN